MPRMIDGDALFNWGKYKLSDAVKYGNKDDQQRSFSYSTLMMYEIADEIADAPTIEAKRGGSGYTARQATMLSVRPAELNGTCMITTHTDFSTAPLAAPT